MIYTTSQILCKYKDFKNLTKLVCRIQLLYFVIRLFDFSLNVNKVKYMKEQCGLH